MGKLVLSLGSTQPHNQDIHIAWLLMKLWYDLLLQQLFHKYMPSPHPCHKVCYPPLVAFCAVCVLYVQIELREISSIKSKVL